MASEQTDYDDSQDLLLCDGQDDIMNELGYGDEPLFGNSNNQMMMLINSLIGEHGQAASLPINMDEFHAIATANLISQTQEAIIKEYNIDMESPDLFGTSFANLEPILPADLESYANSPDSFGNEDNASHTQGDSDIPIEVTEATNADLTNNSQDSVIIKEIDNYFNTDYRATDICVYDQSKNETTTCNVGSKNSSLGLTEVPSETDICASLYKPDDISGTIKTAVDELTSGEIGNLSGEIENGVCTQSENQYSATGKVSVVPNTFRNHTVSYSIKGKEKCTEGSLKKQTKVQTCIIEGDGVVCELCGKLVRHKKGLHNHMATHNPLCCQFPGCDRTFNYPSHYKYHLLTHSQERKFVCECGKTFYTSQQLEVHQRCHNSDKPFTCNQCQKSFTTAGNLKNHQRLHTGERPYICTVNGCGKSFAEDSSLKKHILTHSGVKPYKCGICNKGFTQSSSRSYHMKHKHQQNVILPIRTDTNIGVT